ncbi:MAG: PorP/SprF family type IX secretion system membrane protein [Saprospiraceae bacterium]|nr:PorP/SprF family type IX secretion system membrane protein [Saprospiraceae bacterium]
MLRNFIISLLVSCTVPYFLSAQDIHFSQIGYSPMNLNPALTGIFEGDLRFTGNYRSQWNTVPVEYQTFSGAVDLSILDDRYQQRFFSVGFLLNNDRAGDAQLELTNLGLSGSYARRVGRGQFLSLGLMGTLSQRSFETDDLYFDRQFDNESRQFDPLASSGESFQNNNTKLMADVSAGVNWHYRVPKRERRTSFDAGLGVMHFNKPNKSFLGEKEEKLPIRWSTYAFGNIHLIEQLDLLLQGTYQMQGEYRELAFGLGGQIHLDTDYDKELALQLALNWRSDDAIIPMIGLRYRMWKAAFSYDFNTSPFQVATNQRGGPELSVVYIVTRIKPLSAKICPIYL